MNNIIQLPPAAEAIRTEIKEMIPETTTSSKELPEIKTEIRNDGTKTYLGTLPGGTLLAKRISLLAKEMLLGDVRLGLAFGSLFKYNQAQKWSEAGILDTTF